MVPADSPPHDAVADQARRGGRESPSLAMRESARQLTFGTLLRRLLYLLAAVILFPLVVVIGDHVISGGLPRGVIFGAGILWVLVSACATMGVSLRTLLRRLNEVFVARHVERSRGIAHNPLINMVLLQRSPRADYAREVAVRQAAVVLANSSRDTAGGRVALREPGLALLAAIGLWLLYVAITPKPVLPSLARLFGAQHAAPTATRLALLRPGPGEPVYVGEPLEIVFAVTGRRVEQVLFELLDPGVDDAPPVLRSALTRSTGSDGDDRYRISLAAHEVAADLHYRCTAGDASIGGVIEVQPRADLLGLEIELVPPAYVDEPTRRTVEPDLRVWAGTRATFVASANTALLDPIFVFRGQTETRTRMSVEPADPRRAVLALSLTESGEYRLEFSDLRGRACRDPATHRIVVRPDLAPRVEITTPSREETPADVVDVTHTAWLRVVASDDVRLDGLSLVRDADGTVGRTSLLGSQTTRRGRDAAVELATSDLELEVGQSLLVWFEARDNRVLFDGTPAPQIATSRQLLLVRMPEVIPEQLGDEVGLSDLADAVGTRERVVKRSRTRSGEEGEAGDAGDASAGDTEGPVGPTLPGAKYRRVPGAGTGDEAADDAEQAPEINPEDLVEGGGADDTPQGGVDQDGESNARNAAQREFSEDLRRFNQEHGDEAREVSQRVCSRPDSAGSEAGDDSPAGGDGEGGGGRDSPEEDARSGADTDENANAPGEPQGDGAEQDEQQQPQSRPVESEPPEGTQPRQEDKPEQASEDGSAAEEPEGERDAGDADHAEEPAQPEAPPTPNEGEQQEAGQAERREDAACSGSADSETDGQEPGEQDEREERRQGQGDETQPQQDSGAGAQPDDQQGERVIPMSATGRSPRVEPPTEPEAPAGEANAEVPAGPGQSADATDTLALLGRVEGISADDLVDLGWPLEKRRAFLDAFERLRESARRAGALSQPEWWRTRMELGSGEVTPGAGWSEQVSTGVADAASIRDGLEQIAPPAEQRIAPELRVLLEAYYRSLAEKRTQQGERDVPDSP